MARAVADVTVESAPHGLAQRYRVSVGNVQVVDPLIATMNLCPFVRFLGTGSGFFGEARDASRKGCGWQRN